MSTTGSAVSELVRMLTAGGVPVDPLCRAPTVDDVGLLAQPGRRVHAGPERGRGHPAPVLVRRATAGPGDRVPEPAGHRRGFQRRVAPGVRQHRAGQPAGLVGRRGLAAEHLGRTVAHQGRHDGGGRRGRARRGRRRHLRQQPRRQQPRRPAARRAAQHDQRAAADRRHGGRPDGHRPRRRDPARQRRRCSCSGSPTSPRSTGRTSTTPTPGTTAAPRSRRCATPGCVRDLHRGHRPRSPGRRTQLAEVAARPQDRPSSRTGPPSGVRCSRRCRAPSS